MCNENDGVSMQIRCPECKSICNATVKPGIPWWSFIHHCEHCEYVIMESEWEEVTYE